MMLSKEKKQKIIISLLIIILISYLVFNYFQSGLIYHLIKGDAIEISRMIHSGGIFSPIIFIIIVILEVLLAPIPGIFLYVLGGVSFGWLLGGTLALIGNIIGAYIAFLIGKKLGRTYIEKKASKKTIDMFDSYSKKYGGFTLFLIRLNPLTSSDIFSYLAGIMKMKTWEFLLWTTAALIPLVYIQTLFGDVLLSIKPLYWLFLVIGLLYVAVIIFFTYFHQKK